MREIFPFIENDPGFARSKDLIVEGDSGSVIGPREIVRT